MGISLCMIVKNEGDWVAGAVESVRSIVDEVIIVDTGSTDSTPACIRSIGAKTINLQWQNSFAHARNVSLAEARESWILVLDADERIAARDLPYIKDAVQQETHDGYHLIQRNYVFGNHVFGWTANTGEYEEGARYSGYVDNPLIRLFRNSADIRFHGAVHEIIDPRQLPANFTFSSVPAVMHHYGKVRGEDRVAAKQRFYLALGLKKIEEEPANAKAYFDLGIQYQELGRHVEACACFDQSFEMTRMPVSLLYRAMSEKQLNEFESAAALLNRALRLGLDTVYVHLELGNVHLALGDLPQAKLEYEKCVGIEPANPIALFNLGLVLRKSGDANGAIGVYERALKVDPAFREPLMDLAVLYLKANRAGDALRILANAPQTDPVALSLRGAAHLQNNDLEDARQCLEKALKADRSLKDARLNLAEVYTRKGDHARAARYMQSAAAQGLES